MPSFVTLPQIGGTVTAPTWNESTGSVDNWDNPEILHITKCTISEVILQTEDGKRTKLTPAQFVNSVETGFFRVNGYTPEIVNDTEEDVTFESQFGVGNDGNWGVNPPVKTGKKVTATAKYFKEFGYI